MSLQDLQREIEKLKLENATLKMKKEKEITFKVSEKGGLSVYGLNRFPVTLYKDQWIKLLDKKEEIIEFIEEHEDDLISKN
jgi:hypothetical protein